MTQSFYFGNGISGTTSIVLNSTNNWNPNEYIQTSIVKEIGISPILYFKYVKKKFKILERPKLERRLKTVERAFLEAVENGQDALGEKILRELNLATKESVLYAKGITKYIERSDAIKFKRNLNKGHISDTLLKDYTRIIPKDVLTKKKAVDGCFDDYVIFHYWNEKADDVKNMTPDEKTKMRDPILFGVLKETDRLYFVADWIDEHCDLTFDEMVDVLGKDKKGVIKPKVNLKHFQL